MDVILLVMVVIIGLYMFLKEIGGVVALLVQWLTPLPKADRQLLERHSRYYRSLDPSGKKEFAKRVKEVIFEKEWDGKGLEVTAEMRLRIAGALVQLTFGLPHLLLLHFKRIMVFPNEYMDRTTGNWHQGDVKPSAGVIALSWKHFEWGFDDPGDARNVGLHELAHALWFENQIKNQEHDFLHPELLEVWRQKADREIEQLNKGEGKLFRAYASTNQAEFFAVAVEYFFERPKAFQVELPGLYRVMCRMLGQDPART